jgi:hypothetical protein
MSERLRALSDADLGLAIAGAAPEGYWPPTPAGLPQRVSAEIAERDRGPIRRLPRPAMSVRRRRLLLVAAALLALAAVAAAAKLVIDLGAISIQTIEGRPTQPPTASGPGAFGRPVSLEQAAAVAGFEPLAPAELGSPDRVWVDPGPVSFEEDASRIVMAWAPGPDLPRIEGSTWGAVLMQFEGRADVAYKFVYEDTGRIEEIAVDGSVAYWSTGRHRLDLLIDEGVVTVRVDGNVLLWNDAGLAHRLETALPQRDAVGIAESI